MLIKTQEDKLCYSINTGFGDLCDVRIEPKLQQLQVNLLKNLAVGVEDALPRVIRALMIIRINALVQEIRSELELGLLIDF